MQLFQQRTRASSLWVTPLGHWDFVEPSMQAKSREHVPDLQCAWLLLLFLRIDQSQLRVAGGAPSDPFVGRVRVGVRQAEGLTSVFDGRVGSQKMRCARPRPQIGLLGGHPLHDPSTPSGRR